MTTEISRTAVTGLVDQALREDLGGSLTPEADITTLWTVEDDTPAGARIIARGPGVVAGVEVARAVFLRVDPALSLQVRADDGATVSTDETVLEISGSAAAILTGERTALNFLQQLSGVATLTRAYVEAVAGTAARITDTRKTVPGLRDLQKQAVRCGGGVNHRHGLYDAVLIKENHVTAARGVMEAVRRARLGAQGAGRPEMHIMCEAEDLDQVRALIAGGSHRAPDRILLDNMSPGLMRQCVIAVREKAPEVELEATGSINLKTVRAAAESGVDVISIGALTHSAPALDLSLLFDQ
ncbi:MAG: carboxylating nicotinate-nucleotide diphosphorylase [Candidatus Latescibacteria bacterium]|jgi:nicotinate-nucleotide pyrophosphorylase (carboxylating)|nr:nicotinate-nucleotide diphosphorylase (carboxylating) [Gemmatimonadaceae bacterium]MDP6019361.1 carboxylating nicotinate-nucleotide diphosphorylase [Candidatus Latescibacterota bacterium]MDP7449495.1 carboxylating nicotinate-nucleotide diphosphorylase [Candidatus Latescibacterota bacterium]HJP30976.1 carboxylating nicotinate-nucleotide diphosphorylase [Candidatus Latescibacterota bacterium]